MPALNNKNAKSFSRDTTRISLSGNSALTAEEQNVGSISIIDLKKSMAQILDEKMKILPTKEDIEYIKQHVHNIASQVIELKSENQHLKKEILKLKNDRDLDNKKISLIEEQLKRRNDKTTAINEEVETFLKKTLKMSGPILLKSTRKISTYKGKMTVVAEMDSSNAVEDVLKRSKMLAKTQFYMERDLSTEKQQQKKVMMLLRRNLLNKFKNHKVSVLNEKLRVADKWFKWDKNYNLVCGSLDGKKVQATMYNSGVENIELNYYTLLSEINNK